MKIRIKYNHWYPKLLRYKGIVYYPFVFIALSEGEAKKKHILHHEWIHVQQMRKDGVLNYYSRYVFEFFVNSLRFVSFRKGYRNISYEVEAYDNEKKVKLPRRLE